MNTPEDKLSNWQAAINDFIYYYLQANSWYDEYLRTAKKIDVRRAEWCDIQSEKALKGVPPVIELRATSTLAAICKGGDVARKIYLDNAELNRKGVL